MIDKNRFTLIEYNGVPYPEDFASNIKEIAAHFDKCEIEAAGVKRKARAVVGSLTQEIWIHILAKTKYINPLLLKEY